MRLLRGPNDWSGGIPRAQARSSRGGRPGDALEFDLLVGMHPDEASDVILAAALKFSIPAAVVPCCPRPTEWEYGGRHGEPWISHLQQRSGARRERLEMKGANSVLIIDDRPAEGRGSWTE